MISFKNYISNLIFLKIPLNGAFEPIANYEMKCGSSIDVLIKSYC